MRPLGFFNCAFGPTPQILMPLIARLRLMNSLVDYKLFILAMKKLKIPTLYGTFLSPRTSTILKKIRFRIWFPIRRSPANNTAQAKDPRPKRIRRLRFRSTLGNRWDLRPRRKRAPQTRNGPPPGTSAEILGARFRRNANVRRITIFIESNALQYCVKKILLRFVLIKVVQYRVEYSIK